MKTLQASAYIIINTKLLNLYTLGLICLFFFFFLAKGETTTPRAILTGHDYEITCAAVCAELGLVLSGSQGKVMFYTSVGSSYDVLL